MQYRNGDKPNQVQNVHSDCDKFLSTASTGSMKSKRLSGNVRKKPAVTSSAYLFASHGKRSVEPLLKVGARLEYTRQQEVQQRPQLRQLVLQNSTTSDATKNSTTLHQHRRQTRNKICHIINDIYANSKIHKFRANGHKKQNNLTCCT